MRGVKRREERLDKIVLAVRSHCHKRSGEGARRTGEQREVVES